MKKQNEFDIDKWVMAGLDSLSNMLMIEHYLASKPFVVGRENWMLTKGLGFQEDGRIVMEWNDGEYLIHFRYDLGSRHFHVSGWINSKLSDWEKSLDAMRPSNATSICVLALNALLRPDRQSPEEFRIMVRDERDSLVFTTPDQFALFETVIKKFNTFSRNAVCVLDKDFEPVRVYIENQRHMVRHCELLRKGISSSLNEHTTNWTAIEHRPM